MQAALLRDWRRMLWSLRPQVERSIHPSNAARQVAVFAGKSGWIRALMSQSSDLVTGSPLARYTQLAVLTLAGGAIYPLVYLRQNFEVSILEAFGITVAELGRCYALLGIIFVVAYVPSGWLADRWRPSRLISCSLAATALLGMWFATLPSYQALLVIFAGWGISTGLTFWAALIKGVAVLARGDEQGRFFGLLDGGRGLVEAILASIAVTLFAFVVNATAQPASAALQKVILFYVAVLVFLAPLVRMAITDPVRQAEEAAVSRSHLTLAADLKLILGNLDTWLVAFCILCGYQLFWATYSFSAYLQTTYGLSAVVAGTITVAKLWMRPIGAIAAGFIGDRFDREKTLSILMGLGTLTMTALITLPASVRGGAVIALVLLTGLATYAIRGIYWATLESCQLPDRIKGFAIGLISLVGYSPDVYLPLINGALLERFPGRLGYDIYFAGIVAMGILGTLAAAWLQIRVVRRQALTEPPMGAVPINR